MTEDPMALHRTQLASLCTIEDLADLLQTRLELQMSGCATSRRLQRTAGIADLVVAQLQVDLVLVALDQRLESIGPSFDAVPDDVVPNDLPIDVLDRW